MPPKKSNNNNKNHSKQKKSEPNPTPQVVIPEIGTIVEHDPATDSDFSVLKKLLQIELPMSQTLSSHALSQTKTSLLLAADAGDFSSVTTLLEAKANPDTKIMHPKFNKKIAPLHVAARSGHENVVKILLQNKAHINILEKEDWTPLYYSAFNGHAAICQLLLENKADPLIKDNFSHRTALQVAMYKQFSDIVPLLGGPKDPSEYLRPQSQIDKNGKNHVVLKGIHWKSTDLFLGRYHLSAKGLSLLEDFRNSSTKKDILLPSFDSVLSIPIWIFETHSYETKKALHIALQKQQIPFLRIAAISTNEFVFFFVRRDDSNNEPTKEQQDSNNKKDQNKN